MCLHKYIECVRREKCVTRLSYLRRQINGVVPLYCAHRPDFTWKLLEYSPPTIVPNWISPQWAHLSHGPADLLPTVLAAMHPATHDIRHRICAVASPANCFVHFVLPATFSNRSFPTITSDVCASTGQQLVAAPPLLRRHRPISSPAASSDRSIAPNRVRVVFASDALWIPAPLPHVRISCDRCLCCHHLHFRHPLRRIFCQMNNSN